MGEERARAQGGYAEVLRRIPVGAVLRPLLIMTGLTALYYVLPLDSTWSVTSGIALVLGLFGVAVLFSWHMWAIARSPHPRLRAVEAMVSSLALFLLLFAAAYYLMERTHPHSFTEPLGRTDSLYFTLTVFSTVGFGDITPRTVTARVLTMVQMTGNLVVIGVAGRLLVHAMQTGLHRHAATGEPPESGRGADRPDS